jgi:hypothetical protein
MLNICWIFFCDSCVFFVVACWVHLSYGHGSLICPWAHTNESKQIYSVSEMQSAVEDGRTDVTRLLHAFFLLICEESLCFIRCSNHCVLHHLYEDSMRISWHKIYLKDWEQYFDYIIDGWIYIKISWYKIKKLILLACTSLIHRNGASTKFRKTSRWHTILKERQVLPKSNAHFSKNGSMSK